MALCYATLNDMHIFTDIRLWPQLQERAKKKALRNRRAFSYHLISIDYRTNF